MFTSLALSQAGVAVLDCEHRTPQATSNGHPYIAIPDVVDGRIRISTARLISNSSLREWTRRTTPRAEDIVVTRRGRVGDTAPIPDGLQCAIGQNLVLLRSDGEQVDQKFLRWATRSPQWWTEVNRLMNVGAVFSSLNVGDIGKIELPVPPIQTQQAISDLLGALDDKIAANTKLSETTQEFARITFLHALRAGGERTPLSSIAVHVPGRYLKRDEYVDDGPYLVHGSNSVMGRHDKYMVGGGFAVLARIGSSCGQYAWSESPAWINNNASGIVPQPNIHPLILRFALAGVDMNPHRGGSGQPFIRMDSLFRAEATVPAMSAQGALGSELQAVVDVEHRMAKQSSTLANLRDTLLPQLMSGKLRVRDAERTLSEVL